MFGKPILTFRLLGFEVKVDLSWLIIAGLIIWSLAGGVFPTQYPGLDTWVYVTMGAAAAVGLLMSIVFHELCHSLVARRFGMQMKGITLFIFGGVAEMADEPPSAKAEFFMAAAGPAASVLLALLLWAGWWGAELAAWPTALRGVLGWLAFINGMLVAFNLVPGFPLDGGRILRSALWQWKKDLLAATRIAANVGALFGALLIGLGFLSLLTNNVIGGLWWIVIGLFLRGAAKSSYQQVLVRHALAGRPVRALMNDRPVTVPSNLSAAELVEDFIYRHHYKMFPVVDDGRLAGCVTTRLVRELPRDQWPMRTVGQLAQPCSEANSIGPDEDAVAALKKMTRTHTSRLMVVQDGRLAGILTLKDLMGYLAMKMEVEGSVEMKDMNLPPSDE